jgi:hypothetical protein
VSFDAREIAGDVGAGDGRERGPERREAKGGGLVLDGDDGREGHEVGLLAWLQRSGERVCAERLGTQERRAGEELARVGGRSDLAGRIERVRDGGADVEGAPGGDVAREADADPAAPRFLEVELTAAEEIVRIGAMCDRGARGGHAVPLGVGEMDGVGEDGARPEQPNRLVDAEVVLGEGVDGQGLDTLAGVLGDVGLHGEVEVVRELSGALEHASRAAQGEARGDGEAEEPLSVKAVSEEARSAKGLLGRDGERVRAALVHEGEAEGRAHTSLGHRLEHALGGAGMRRREGHEGGRPDSQRRVDEELRGRARVGFVGEASLFREDRRLEPIEQGPGGRADDARLRYVEVRVDEPGDEQRTAQVVDERVSGFRVEVSDVDDAVPFDREGAVRVEAELEARRRANGREDRAPVAAAE